MWGANALGGVLDGSVRFKEAFKRRCYMAGLYKRKRALACPSSKTWFTLFAGAL